MTTPSGKGRGYANRNKEFINSDNQSKFGTGNSPNSSDKMTPQKSPMANSAAVSKLPSSSQMSALNRNSQQMSYNNTQIDSAANHAKNTNLKSGRPKALNLNKQTSDVKNNHVDTGNYYDPGQFEDNETFTDENAQSVLYIDDKYSYLVEQVRVLSETDDGILTNQKLKHLEDVITRVCPQPHHLRGVMESLASSSILDITMAGKVSKMMSSVSFFFLQIHQQRLYHVFIAALHDKIDGLEISLDGADKYFINSATVLTEIFKESKVRDADNTSTLAHLIIQVFIGLLECNTHLALRTLNVQLMQYGRNLYPLVTDKLNNLSLSARKLIISRQPPRSSCRIWLSLLADQCLFRFQPLPKYLQDFYARHLDESNCDLEPRDSCFASELPVTDDNCVSKLPQTLSNQKIQEYYYTREKRNSDSSDKWSVISNGDRGYCRSVANSEQHNDDLLDDDLNKHDLSFDSLSMSERKPRPILGAGSKKPLKLDGDQSLESSQQYSNSENNSEIPKFCPSVPPPNYHPPKNNPSDSRGNKSNVSQDGYEFWNHPPPVLPPANLNNKRFENSSGLSKRLDLNTWRQQSNSNNEHNLMYSDSTDDNLMNKNDPSERISTFSTEEIGGQAARDNNKLYTQEIRNRDSCRADENAKNQSIGSDGNRSFDEMKESKAKNFESRQADAYWESRKSTSSNDGDHNNSKIANRLLSDKKRFEGRKDNNRFSKNSEDPDANWKSSESEDNKISDNKSEAGSEKRLRGDARANSRGKRDLMEVSRKASYWTHDDRCETDYNG